MAEITCPNQKLFKYIIMMAAMSEEDARSYSGKLSSKDGRSKINFNLQVVPIEWLIPLNHSKMLLKETMFSIPLCMMKQMLDCEKIDEGIFAHI